MLPPLVATDPTDVQSYPMDFIAVHSQGIPHRCVHLEIFNSGGELFLCRREDERLEIPGGHVEWLESENRPESYEEAALREIIEELNLLHNWAAMREEVVARLQGHLQWVHKTANQFPSSQGNNNEWVTVYRIDWQSAWGDPLRFKLSEEGNHEPRWSSIEKLMELSLEHPAGINSAVRLLLLRRGILVPIIH